MIVPGKRLCQKSHGFHRIGEAVGFRETWKSYVRGKVVSESAVRLIRNFLMACISHSGQDEDEDEVSRAQLF